MKTKREAYAQKMAEARHHARLENHGLKPVTVYVLPDDRAAIETAADQINQQRGYLNSVFDHTSGAPFIRRAVPGPKTTAQTSAPAPTAPFLIALPTLAAGELYAGLVLDEDRPTHHLILLPQQPSELLNWHDAMAWAKSVGGDLPTRQEQALLYANVAYALGNDWYWSSNQVSLDPSCAWIQFFDIGTQNHSQTRWKGHARAIRRQIID